MYLNKKEKHFLIGIIILLYFATIMLMAIAVDKFSQGSQESLTTLFFKSIFAFGIGQMILTIFGFCSYIIIKNLNKDTFETHLRLLALKFSNWRQQKNVSIISPYLQNFFFYVLKKNNEFLHLPLGQDDSVLSLAKAGTVFRDNCIFYQYQLILPEDIEQEANTLRRLIQQFICAEINNYGIPGLHSTYCDNKTGTWLTVYLDRIIVNAEEHWIIFDLLYISSQNALGYVQKAVKRDDVQPTAEPEVFDDEL